MEVTQLERLAKMRMVVGYLGEREQYGWWQSSFFARGSQAFLAPVFARTQLLAQCAGVTRAAAVIHDERIGVGHVYHLFRLPEDVEQGLHRVLHDRGLGGEIAGLVSSREAALNYLRAVSVPPPPGGVGPTIVGDTLRLRHAHAWSTTAGHYLRAFDGGVKAFP
ncbi:MAG TPA: BrxE family protein [Ardenticatenaceae bacterium]|nr:BrxE family protein [Ardenticatenaceae bacterium]